MTPELLRAAGEAFYGDQWVSPLARDLSVSARTIHRWVRGDNPIPSGVVCALWVDAERRVTTMTFLAQELRDRAVRKV